MRLETKFYQSYPIFNHRYVSKSKKSQVFRSKPSKELEIPDVGAKPQVWHHWPIHFESTKTVTQLIAQVNVM